MGPAGDSDRAATETWESLFRAQSTLFRRFSASPVWQGRTTRDYDVLFQLSRAPEHGMRQRDLTDRLMISQPSLSRQLDRLIAEGLVVSSPDPRDGRGALLSLSSDGAALQRRIGALHARDVARVLREKLTAEQLQQLKALTDQLLS